MDWRYQSKEFRTASIWDVRFITLTLQSKIWWTAGIGTRLDAESSPKNLLKKLTWSNCGSSPLCRDFVNGFSCKNSNTKKGVRLQLSQAFSDLLKSKLPHCSPQFWLELITLPALSEERARYFKNGGSSGPRLMGETSLRQTSGRVGNYRWGVFDGSH